MQNRFYVDTCIWRDLFEERKGGLVPLGEFAFLFFKNCVKYKCIIVISSFVLFELKKAFSQNDINSSLEPFLDVIEFVDISYNKIERLFLKQGNIIGVHNEDITHALIAKEFNCVLITRDKHFDSLVGIVSVLAPEEVDFDNLY